MRKYDLGFIKDDDMFEHVKNTVLQYRRSINLTQFNQNIIDPIKLTFDAKIYSQSFEETIKSECIRQIDKSNNNKIGYFHQHIFKYAGNAWEVPENGEKGGFDVINDQKHVYVEIKNKHNTMNAASSSDTYIKMQNKLLDDDKATCMLVETIAKRSQDIPWEVAINKNGRRIKFCHDRIRRVSMDKFYAFVFGDDRAFLKLCVALPHILDDVISESENARLAIDVYDELDKGDFYKSLYLLAFSTYEGFQDFHA